VNACGGSLWCHRADPPCVSTKLSSLLLFHPLRYLCPLFFYVICNLFCNSKPLRSSLKFAYFTHISNGGSTYVIPIIYSFTLRFKEINVVEWNFNLFCTKINYTITVFVYFTFSHLNSLPIYKFATHYKVSSVWNQPNVSPWSNWTVSICLNTCFLTVIKRNTTRPQYLHLWYWLSITSESSAIN
jgi:hypothetical protein